MNFDCASGRSSIRETGERSRNRIVHALPGAQGPFKRRLLNWKIEGIHGFKATKSDDPLYFFFFFFFFFTIPFPSSFYNVSFFTFFHIHLPNLLLLIYTNGKSETMNFEIVRNKRQTPRKLFLLKNAAETRCGYKEKL